MAKEFKTIFIGLPSRLTKSFLEGWCYMDLENEKCWSQRWAIQKQIQDQNSLYLFSPYIWQIDLEGIFFHLVNE